MRACGAVGSLYMHQTRSAETRCCSIRAALALYAFKRSTDSLVIPGAVKQRRLLPPGSPEGGTAVAWLMCPGCLSLPSPAP